MININFKAINARATMGTIKGREDPNGAGEEDLLLGEEDGDRDQVPQIRKKEMQI